MRVITVDTKATDPWAFGLEPDEFQVTVWSTEEKRNGTSFTATAEELAQIIPALAAAAAAAVPARPDDCIGCYSAPAEQDDLCEECLAAKGEERTLIYDHCETTWAQVWTADVDDDCPVCGASISPNYPEETL